MTIAQTNTIAKVAAVVAGLGLVAMSFASFAVPANAQTTSLQAQIAALQAQLAALMAQAGTTTTTTTTTTFNTDLTIGSTGSDVTALQNWLIANGNSIPAGATGYFGSQTQAAVAAYQAAKGITPAVGYFGPLTRASVNAQGGGSTSGGLPAGCTSTSGFSPTSGASCSSSGGTTTGLSGGSGYLSNISTQGDINSDVREGDAGDKIVGFSAYANGSDIALDRLDVTFDMSGVGAGSTNLNQYVQSVSVWLNGQKLGSMDPANGSYDSKLWTLRFSNLNGVIKEGTTGTVYVAVDAVSSIGSNEDGATVTAEIPVDGVRVNDAQGVSDTYITTAIDQAFTVSSANTGTLTLTEASDNPDATTVKADPSNTTTNVTLLAFNAKATNQDITVRAIPVNVLEDAANLNDAVQSIALMQGSQTISTKTITSTGASQEVLFDNLNQTISEGNTTEYTVVATVRKIDSGNTFATGDYVYATSSAQAPTDNWDVSDSNGDSVTPAGAVTGEHQTFTQTGVTVANAGTSYIKNTAQNAGQGDSTQYSVSFKVTAGDTDLYIQRNIIRSLTANQSDITWATTTSSTASTTIPNPAVNLSAGDTNTGDAANFYKIPAGGSRTFTLNVTLTEGGPTGFTGVQLTGIGYGTTTDGTNILTPTTYTSGLDSFKTADVSMTVH